MQGRGVVANHQWRHSGPSFSVWYLQHDIRVSQGAIPSAANLCPGASCHCASRAKLVAIGSRNGMSSDKVLHQRLKCTTITRRDVLLEFPSTGGLLENRFVVVAYLCLTSWTFFLLCPEGQLTIRMSLHKQRLFWRYRMFSHCVIKKSFPVRRLKLVFSL